MPGLRQEAADAISRRQTPKALYSVSASQILDSELITMSMADTEEITVTINSINSAQNLTVVTWDIILKCIQEDGPLVKLLEQVERRFPDSQHDLHKDIREFHKFRHGYVVDGVEC